MSSLSDSDLIARMPDLVLAERTAMHNVIVHLIEIERRRLYLDQACSSLYAYCQERLGYSEDEALKRVRVARLADRVPQVLEELKSGQIHLTGLFLLSQHLTPENADSMLTEARGKSRREIELLIARARPRPDVPDRTEAMPTPLPGLSLGSVTCPGTGSSSAEIPRPRVEPLSATSYRIEFTASAELHEKLQRAGELLSHVVPAGNLAMLVERALDTLIEAELKKRTGAGKARKPRKLRPGSRHVPLDVARIVWQRDGDQCTYLDAEGRRCSERRYLTIEHCDPHACGGLATPDNLRLLCAGHNAHTAQQVFGKAHIAEKRAEREASELQSKVLKALVHSGFSEREAKRALREIGSSVKQEFEPLIRAALKALVPPSLHVRDGSRSPFAVGLRGGRVRSTRKRETHERTLAFDLVVGVQRSQQETRA